MIGPPLACRVERRRGGTRRAGWNGIDYLEVDEDQQHLCVRFLGDAPEDVAPANVVIEGGTRIRDIRVVAVQIRLSTDPDLDDCLEVAVDRPGDFSTYRLCLVDLDEEGRPTNRPFPGFDPRYSCIEFSFKAECPSPFDCAIPDECPPPVPDEPDEPAFDYLAKDYASFRQLVLDRLALVMPEWRERHVPDLYLGLVEILAYTGDRLSYHQDAVATEAYLETARRRISVRRQARLVDYVVHEGCNARAWVSLETDTDLEFAPGEIAFATGRARNGVALPLGADGLDGLLERGALVFEPVDLREGASFELRRAHNLIRFHTWGDRECCLLEGATSAVLRDDGFPDEGEPLAPDEPVDVEAADKAANGDGTDEPPPAEDGLRPAKPDEEGLVEPVRALRLQPGDVLILEEVKGARTGDPADRDPTRRHAVRLTRVTPTVDPLYTVPAPGQDARMRLPLVEVEWDEDDALPFALCISSLGPPPECALLEDVSVARGNVLLVDHGRSVGPEGLGTVEPEPEDPRCEAEGRPAEVSRQAKPFAPALELRPLTFREAPPRQAPASRLLAQELRLARPQLWLRGKPKPPSPSDDPIWEPRVDLLASGAQDQHVVVEMDDEGRAHLRFGDGELGAAPRAGTAFRARYRIGNGTAGNVGAGAINQAVSVTGTLAGVQLLVTNPLPARGGADRESIAEAKRRAPFAFRAERVRAVVPEDYAELAQPHPAVQRAAAELRWTGSWYRITVAVDPKGRVEAERELLREIRRALYPYRRIGHDLAVVQANVVAFDLGLLVCVRPDYLQGHVLADVYDVLGSRRLPDGRLGFFHPDNLTFGQGVFVSGIVAAVQAVPGVESVSVTKLERLFEGPNAELDAGVLRLGATEVARLDNDRSFPEHGRLHVTARGGL